MSQFEFNLATPEDDVALRELLASTPMRGEISLAFAREPSYFGAAAVDGQFVQVVAAREKRTCRIVGMGSRAISRCFVNGRVENVGYLSALRLLTEYHGQAGLVARGYRLFRELHDDHRALYYLTTIAADNHQALDLLTSRRAGLPVYRPLGSYYTLTLSSSACRSQRTSGRVAIRSACATDGETIVRFLHSEGPKRQFFPAFDANEFFDSPQRLLGLRPESLLLAFDGDRLVGTLGIWDQRPFKQNVVSGYSNRLSTMRPIYNLLAALRSKPRLPRVGQSLNLRYAAIPVVAGDDPGTVRALIHSALECLREQRGELLCIGLHEDDPLLPLVRSYSGREFATKLFLVHWPDERPEIETLIDRVPYLELGCL